MNVNRGVGRQPRARPAGGGLPGVLPLPLLVPAQLEEHGERLEGHVGARGGDAQRRRARVAHRVEEELVLAAQTRAHLEGGARQALLLRPGGGWVGGCGG